MSASPALYQPTSRSGKDGRTHQLRALPDAGVGRTAGSPGTWTRLWLSVLLSVLAGQFGVADVVGYWTVASRITEGLKIGWANPKPVAQRAEPVMHLVNLVTPRLPP